MHETMFGPGAEHVVIPESLGPEIGDMVTPLRCRATLACARQRIWHTHDSQGQILALASAFFSTRVFQETMFGPGAEHVVNPESLGPKIGDMVTPPRCRANRFDWLMWVDWLIFFTLASQFFA